MDDNVFWDAINRSREVQEYGIEAQAEELESVLAAWTPEGIAAFDAAFVQRNLELYASEVPGQDLRAIRRAVLDLSAFEASEVGNVGK